MCEDPYNYNAREATAAKGAHTKGPWKVYIGQDGWGVHASECLIASCKIYAGSIKETIERQQADARLIAAAPDLLEALEDACTTYAFYGEQPPEKWLKAVQKARAGGQP
jgi:hypothetical protein